MQGRPDLRTVQALRAAACVLVVAYHAVIYRPGEITAWPNGAAGVDLFFVISGYVMFMSGRTLVRRSAGWRHFLVQRVRRIVPLYWTCTTLKYGFALVMPGLAPHTRPGPWSLAASLLFIPARDRLGNIRPILPVGWTLNFEALFYGLFAITLALRITPFAMTPLLAALAIAGFWRDPGWPAACSVANGLVLEFAAGMALAATRHRIPVGLAPFLLAASATLILNLPSCGPWRFLVWGGPAVAILAACLALEQTAGARLPPWLLAVGDASYAIYLVHPLIVPALARHGALAASAAVPLSIAAGILVHRWLDAPLQRRLAGRHSAPPPHGAGVLSG